MPRLGDIVDEFEPITLEELDAKAALQRRTDRKYLLPADRLTLLTELRT